MNNSYDAVIVGGGHNGLVAAAYLARAGRSVLVLERDDVLGGAARSARIFPEYDARISKYAYLVSLLPEQIVEELGLDVQLLRRRVSSYTPVDDGGLLVDEADAAATAAQLGADADGWFALYEATARVAEKIFPTLLEPLRSRDALRRHVGADEAFTALFERPIGELIESRLSSDLARGVVLTDGLIGTFSHAHARDLAANRCFLYHVIGGGTGHWDVPVGGMGAVTQQLQRAAERAGAELRTAAEVTAVRPDSAAPIAVELASGQIVQGRQLLANVAPAVLARLLGEQPTGLAPEGAQLKINMLLSRLPRLRDPGIDPADAFAGTFHVNESYTQLQTAYEQANSGRIPELPPCEIYCHSLSDPSILGEQLRAGGAQTLTLFGLHMPARLFRADPAAALRAAREATLASLDSVLAEPIADCLLDPGCVEVMGPLEIEANLGMPGGNIFHRDLQWPFAESPAEEGRWGVETRHPDVFLCGAGARRGGAVSGIPGRNAAMAALQAH